MRRLSARGRLFVAVMVCGAGAMALVPVGAATSPSAGAAAARCKDTVNVKMGDADGGDRLFFSKRKVTIRTGDCVRWKWTGVLRHNVEGPGFRSKTRRAPFRYRKRFAKARRTPALIICGVHPSMRMRVAVKAR